MINTEDPLSIVAAPMTNDGLESGTNITRDSKTLQQTEVRSDGASEHCRSASRHRLRRASGRPRLLGGNKRTPLHRTISNDLDELRKAAIRNCNSVGGESRRGVRRAVSMDYKRRELYTPNHGTLAPKRSSFSKGKRRSGMPRRQVSFGRSNSVEVEQQYDDKADKKELWYDQKELKRLQRKVAKLALRSKEELDDDSQECWRGLESHARKFQQKAQASPSADATADERRSKQLVLQLYLMDDKKDTCEGEGEGEGLRVRLQQLMSHALNEGRQQAADDAAEALAIYMETMDSNQVEACFRSARGA